MLDIDPDREPEDTAAERAEIVLSRLYLDPDAVRRYHTVQALQDGRLRDVAAVSMRQLRDELGSTDAAADALGISRQAVNELLAKAGAPGARADKNLRERPAYAYGRYFDHVCAIADATGDERKALECYDLYEHASQTLAVLPKLEENASRWLKDIRRRSTTAADHLNAIRTELVAPVAQWLAARPDDKHMNHQEQGDFVLGMHHASAARRAERRG